MGFTVLLGFTFVKRGCLVFDYGLLYLTSMIFCSNMAQFSCSLAHWTVLVGLQGYVWLISRSFSEKALEDTPQQSLKFATGAIWHKLVSFFFFNWPYLKGPLGIIFFLGFFQQIIRSRLQKNRPRKEEATVWGPNAAKAG